MKSHIIDSSKISNDNNYLYQIEDEVPFVLKSNYNVPVQLQKDLFFQLLEKKY